VLGAAGPKILTLALARSDVLIVAARKACALGHPDPARRTITSLTGADGTTTVLTVGTDLTVVGRLGLTDGLGLSLGLTPADVPRPLSVRTCVQTISVALIESGYLPASSPASRRALVAARGATKAMAAILERWAFTIGLQPAASTQPEDQQDLHAGPGGTLVRRS
jgi:hypothetical protein